MSVSVCLCTVLVVATEMAVVFICVDRFKVKKVKCVYSSSLSLAIWDHTVLHATRHKVNVHRLNPSQIYLPQRDRRMS